MTELRNPGDLKPVSSRPSIGDLVALIEADDAVSGWRRRSVPCTIRVLSRRLNCDFHSMPADPPLIRAKLASYHPRKGGTGKARWNNLRHDLTFILAYAGFIAVPSRSRVPITPIWQDLVDQVPLEGDRRVLKRFARYCIDRRIAPSDVNGDIADAYLRDLRENSLDRDPQTAHRRALVAWNTAGESVAAWPERRLEVPDYRNHWTLPLTAYPKSFRKEIQDYFEWLAGGNPFDAQARSQPLKPATIKTREHHIRYAAAALVAEGRDTETITSLSDLVEPKASEIILRHLYERHGSKITVVSQGWWKMAEAA